MPLVRGINDSRLVIVWLLSVRVLFTGQVPDLQRLTYRLPSETFWLHAMSSSSKSLEPGSPKSITAPFAPYGSSSTTRQQKTVLVRQKTPLLVATPPQITRALAQCHPFLLTLDKVAGLLLWSSGDPWESFLLVASFWVIVLYGDPITRWGGPILLVTSLIVGMYSKRYSPLSSTRFTGEKRKRNKREDAEEQIRHQKSLDEIVDTLDNFTSRCNLLLEPFLQLTDFLSTQQTPTSATSRPTLTTFFTRIILITPLWIVLTLPPMRIITSRRVVLAVGTLGLSWHSRPARVTRTLLWRSLTIRRIVSIVTGLSFIDLSLNTRKPPPLPPRSKNQHDRASSLANTGEAEAVGVRFTFVLYENQRRWLGLGWTSSLFNYERAPWTDEHLQPSPPKDQFQLPDVDSGMARWRWVPGCEWKFESNVELDKAGGAGGTNEDGWIYYDNKVIIHNYHPVVELKANRMSGMMGEDRTVGADIHAVESGTETQSLLIFRQKQYHARKLSKMERKLPLLHIKPQIRKIRRLRTTARPSARDFQEGIAGLVTIVVFNQVEISSAMTIRIICWSNVHHNTKTGE